MLPTRFLCLTGLFIGLGLSILAGEPIAIGNHHVLHSKHLEEERPLMVYLPKSYAANPDKRYPVLFSLDGETHFKAVVGTVDWLSSSADAIPEHIVVAIANTPGNRSKDLVSLPNQLARNQAFTQFIASELLPFVDANWRTQPFRILSGHSLAGLFTLQMLSERPELFRAYLVASPYFAIDQGATIAKMADALPRQSPQFSFVYATLGDEAGLKPLFDQWVETMTAKAPKNLLWQKKELPREIHMTTPMPTLHGGLRSLYADLALPPNSETMQKGVASIKDYYQTLSKKKYGFPVSAEAALTNCGLLTAQKGNLQMAIEILTDTSKAYPKSWKARLSLSRVLEAGGQLQASLEAAATAQNLASHADPSIQQFLQQRVTGLKTKVAASTKSP